MDGYDEILERNMISLGDFNIDLLNENSFDLCNLVTSNGFTVVNKIDSDSFTRRDIYSRSIIDHIHSDVQNNLLVQLGESALSDHRFFLVDICKVGISDNLVAYNRSFVDYNKVSQLIESKLTARELTTFDEFHSHLKTSINQATKIK